jgi:hypothetical protein
LLFRNKIKYFRYSLKNLVFENEIKKGIHDLADVILNFANLNYK